MSYELKKPYTEKQKVDFLVQYNHNQGLKIEETDQALYALEPNEMMAWVEVEEEIQVEIEPAEYETVETPAVTETLEDGTVIKIEPARTEKRLVKAAVYETQTITVQRYMPIINPNYEQEQLEKEQERIKSLKVTKRVFALALQKLGITYNQLKELIATNEQAQLEWDLCVELERSNPLLDVMGAEMGLTPQQLDYIFQKANGEDEKE